MLGYVLALVYSERQFASASRKSAQQHSQPVLDQARQAGGYL